MKYEVFMKFKNIVLASLLFGSLSVSADYIVFPQGKGDVNSGNINVPEPGCESDVSGLEDGMYILCSQNDNIEYPVVNGQAFRLSRVIPKDAFTCPLGLRYSNDTNKGYAYDDDAIKLSALMNVNIYTPNYSWPSFSPATSGYIAKGRSTYREPDGGTNFDVVELFDNQNSRDTVRYTKRNGDSKTIYGRVYTGSTGTSYYSQTDNTRKPAYRACLIE